MSLPIVITFMGYFALLLIIGFWFYQRNVSIEDYLLGGRAMGSWVTALSAQASDMSGWLLMGLPGAIYMYGIGQIWIAIGLFIGTVLNWYLVSARLRLYTERTKTITLPCFFERRFRDPTGLLRTISAIIILIFFTIYATSGLVAAGKLFESVFDVNYTKAVVIGGVIIIVYTFLGGFMAVCWTDLLQGSLMVTALVIVPWAGFKFLGGIEPIRANMARAGISMSLLPKNRPNEWLGIVSTLAWGLGYFGQPHILTRFMSVEGIGKLKKSMTIAIFWVLFSLAGACCAGLIGIGLIPGLTGGEQEKIFIYMIDRLFNPWAAGVMLSAILSAIMSTIDSQLLVSSSALTEDFYRKEIRPDAPQREVVFVGHVCVVITSAIALVLALHPSDTILGIVAYAWGGFGAAFGPLVLFSLYSRRMTWQAALAGMAVGTVTLVVWKQMGLDTRLYEIVPGFIGNCMTIMVVNSVFRQEDAQVLEEFDTVAVQAGRLYF